MTILRRAAGLLSRVFPKHVAMLSGTFDEYPRTPRVGVILTLSEQDAVAYGQIRATPERVLLAALEDEEVAAHVASRGATVEAWREALLVTLATPSVAAEARAVPRSKRLTLGLGHALERMRRRGAAFISRGDLLAGLASTEGETSRLLATLSVDLTRLDTETAQELPERASATEPRVAIYVMNDAVSTMEDVMRVLEHGFDMSVRTAFHRMLTTHVSGHAHIGTYPRAKANELLTKAERHADARSCKVRFYVGRAA